jgi:hypothetical protein
MKEDEEYLRFQASIHGVKLGGSERAPTASDDNLEKIVPLFGDPKDYESMSQEEREELTRKMMGKHKQWASSAFEAK